MNLPRSDAVLAPIRPYYPYAAGAAPQQAAGGDFIRGFVAGGCLSAFQDRPSPTSPADLKRVLRHALQAGTALTAGAQAAAALHRQDYGAALLTAAAGAAGVLFIERMLRDAAQADMEKDNG